MKNIKKSLIGLVLISISSLAFAEKTYTCTAIVSGNATNNTVQITVMSSQSSSDAEVKAANVFSQKGIKFDRISCEM